MLSSTISLFQPPLVPPSYEKARQLLTEHYIYDESHNCLLSRIRTIQRLTRGPMRYDDTLCVLVYIAIDIFAKTAKTANLSLQT
jgi:hypothetical protein